jgi:DNA-binding SARP family transcriptional activator
VTSQDDQRIHVLGDLRVFRRGKRLSLPPSKKTRALLVYLVATARSHSREHLCDLLWEGPDDPRAALRWSLAKLRPLLETDCATRLVTDRDRVAFAAIGAETDLACLSALAEAGVPSATAEALEQAARLFTGEFAEGLDLPACFRFHEWCVAERERWSAFRLTILTALVDRLRDTPEAALVHARARVAIDPLDEGGHAAVIRLLAALGRQREALRQYEYGCQVLTAELGARPGPELESAVAAARQPRRLDDAARLRPAVARLRRAVERVTDAQLVGRSDEFATLDGLALAATESRADTRLVVLTGDPGIGKSRLLQCLGDSMAARGGQALSTRAFEAEMRRPYGIWTDLLKLFPKHAISGATWAGLQPLTFEATLSSSVNEGDRARLFAAVMSMLTELSSRTPIAILIDDIQWIDESSASLLHYLVRSLAAPCRIVLAATARPGELADNAAAQLLLRNLDREGRKIGIPLGPLDEDASVRLAKSISSDHDVASVVAAAEGNPFFTLELARALASGAGRMSETLVSGAGRMSETLASGAGAMPETIENVLAARLSRPEGTARTILPWAAALGREFNIDVLSRCVKLSPTEWDHALDELERCGIICDHGEANYDFAHDLIRAAAYGRISSPRRRLIHGQIAQAIAAILDGNQAVAALAGELARHAALGGNDALAARGSALAAERAMRVFANKDAIDLALRGLHHLTRMAPGPERASVHIALLKTQVLASSGSRQRRWPGLLGALSDATAAAEAEDLTGAAATGYYLLSVLHQDEGEIAQAQATTLRAAEAGRNGDAATAAAQLANTARCMIELEFDTTQADGLLKEAGVLLDRSRSENVEFFWGGALLKRWGGSLDAAVLLMKAALRLARSNEDRWRESKCLTWLAAINLELGAPQAVLAYCEELRPLAAKMGENGELPFAEALEALTRRILHLPDATHGLAMALERLRAFDSKAHLAYVLNIAAQIDFEEGDLTAASGAAQEALVAAEATRRVWEAAISRAILARVLAARGDRAGARRRLGPTGARAAPGSGLSARARSAELLASRDLELRIPTLDQTLS